jgi:hypothetical protein
MNNKNSIFNSSGCKDTTAFEAVKSATKEEQELDHKVHEIINVLKRIIDITGFELIGRIQIKHKKSGREYK